VSTQEVEPIIKRAPEDVGTIPFQSTLFGRKELADRLTGYVERSSDGCVIGITAPWGEGKTYFGIEWKKSLQEKGHKTFFLDAFQDDFSDDAFTTISAELLRGLSASEPKSRALWKATKKLGAALLPAAAKLTLSAAANFATGLTTDEIAEVIEKAGDSGAEVAERYVEKRLKNHEARLNTIKHFRIELTKYCKEQPKPVVFFIDELDRCRPPYAVQVIEHIKHFFDVPNLVFVLLLNREQLERSIQRAYGGEKEDAARYLGKFVHFFLTLPNAQSRRYNVKPDLTVFCQQLATSHGFENTNGIRNFIDVLVSLAPHFDLSLRDIQRAFVYLRLTNGMEDYYSAFAYLIALKLRHSDVFSLLQRDSKSGSARAAEIMEALDRKDPSSWWSRFLLLHRMDSGQIVKATDEERKRLDGWMKTPEQSRLLEIIEKIDLPSVVDN
jgi:hypothetical protein